MTDPRGCVVRSLAGRDKGRSFVIVEKCDEAHVYIADGSTHKLEKPKKKKLKHLRFTGESMDLSNMPSKKSGAADAFLRKEFKAVGLDSEDKIKEG